MDRVRFLVHISSGRITELASETWLDAPNLFVFCRRMLPRFLYGNCVAGIFFTPTVENPVFYHYFLFACHRHQTSRVFDPSLRTYYEEYRSISLSRIFGGDGKTLKNTADLSDMKSTFRVTEMAPV